MPLRRMSAQQFLVALSSKDPVADAEIDGDVVLNRVPATSSLASVAIRFLEFRAGMLSRSRCSGMRVQNVSLSGLDLRGLTAGP